MYIPFFMTEQLADLLTTFARQSNTQLSEFFFDNSEKLDSLVQLYGAFNQQTTAAQMRRIRELKRALHDPNWRVQEGLELIYCQFNTERPLIIIEGGFESTRGNTSGKFIIRIITRTIQAWNYYEDQLMKDFPSIEPVIGGDKTTLVVNTIWGDDETEIISALMNVQHYLLALTDSYVVI
jgi:hypothetical protein